MFTLSKSSTELTFDSNAHEELGSKLQETGGRILLICSTDPRDKASIARLKKVLTDSNLTFIQNDQPKGVLTREHLDELQFRTENFMVKTVVSLGGITQRMSGRFVAQRLSLNYFELPTEYNNPYLLVPIALYSNRVGNKIEDIYLSEYRINGITLDTGFLREQDDFEIALNALSMLLQLAHLFIAKENNIIARAESRNLFLRLLDDMNNSNLNRETLYRYGLTVALYQGASSNIDLYLINYAWLSGERFKISPHLISGKLLPWLLEQGEEEDLALRIRDVLERLEISFRLSDLGITLKQLTEINSESETTISLVNNAF